MRSADNRPNAGTMLWEKLQIPPRSEFYHLEPVGVGTPYVESLSSYATRLAHEHFVSPYPLMRCVMHLSPTTGRVPIREDRSSKATMGAGISASNLVSAFETLTMRRDLSWTTMITWANVLSERLLIRTKKAWCPACYETWRQRDEIVYEPLLWALEPVTVCPIHNIPLTSSCSNCTAQFYYSIRRDQPGFCARCKVWLGNLPETSRPDGFLESTEDSKWQLWKARSAGELLASAPNLQTPVRSHVVKSLRYCIDKYGWGRTNCFISRFKMSEALLRSWLLDKAIPALEAILQLTYKMDVSLLSFLCGNLDPESQSLREEDKDKDRGTRKPITDSPLLPEAVKIILAAAASSEEHPSLQRLVELTGWHRSSLQLYFPDLCTIILINHSDHHRRYVDETKALPVLQAALLENPPPPFSAVAERIGPTRHALKSRFPELAGEIVARHKAYRYSADWERIEEDLKKILSQEIALSLGATSRSIGVSVDRLGKRFPELTAAIKRKYKEYAQLQKEARERLLRQEVQEAVIAIQGEGLYPSLERIAGRVKTSRNAFKIHRALRSGEAGNKKIIADQQDKLCPS
jgi:hypothetical protein